MEKIISWREGFPSRGVSPEQVHEALRAIERQHGAVSPELLVAAAREPEHPAHPLFTWDDALAAQRWREHEAQRVIGAIMVTVEVRQGKAKEPPIEVAVRAFHNVKSHSYVHLDQVRGDYEMRKHVVGDALREVRSMEERLRALAAVFGEPLQPALVGLAESRQRLEEGL